MKSDSPVGCAMALFGTAAMLLAHLVAGLVVVVVLCRVVPVYMKLYDDWNMELPAATQSVIRVSYFMACYWHLVALGFLILDGAILLVLHLLPPGARWLKTCWNTAVLLAVILFLGYAALALAIPLTTAHPANAAAPSAAAK
jgi:hypothetical protein